MAEANDKAEFERQRLAYVTDIYKREFDRRDRMEKKSQFQVSFATLLMGAFVIKPDVFKLIGEANRAASLFARATLLISLAGLGTSILGALLSTLLAVRVQQFTAEYPAKTTSELLDPEITDWKDGDLAGMLRSFTANYIAALEAAAAILEVKARWVRVSWYFVVGAATFLALFLVTLCMTSST